MTTSAMPMDDLLEVAETVLPGDQVKLATNSHEYKNSIPVVGVVVTEWESPGENWRTARVDLRTKQGVNHEIVGVEGGRDPRDYTSGQWFYVRNLEPVQDEEGSGDALDPVEQLEQQRIDRGRNYSSVNHLSMADVLEAVESSQTMYEVSDQLRVSRETSRWLLRELGLYEAFESNKINGSSKAELLEEVRQRTAMDVPDGDDSWKEIYERAEGRS